MKLMRLLIKKIANLKVAIYLRNFLNIRPKKNNNLNYSSPISISDCFVWRTDNGFKTKFKYTDILNFFLKVKNSWVEIHIYSKKNKLLKIEKIKDLDLSNEFEITSKYLDNLEDYGVFYIYHFTNDTLEGDNAILNRCYLGFSKNNSLYSFVHGNVAAKFTAIKGSESSLHITDRTSIFKECNYKIQKYFYEFDRNELFIANYTSKSIKFTVENKNYKLYSGNSIIIQTFNSIINIESNCYIRPTIFSYKKKFFDVHHG
jgi:hypothetical protein